MTTIPDIRKSNNGILVSGIHPGIIQSVLDFDAMRGSEPSIKAIVAGNRKSLKCFFGSKEILIPCFRSMADVPEDILKNVSWLLNLQSGRRAAKSVSEFFEKVPHAAGAHVFAENVPETHSLSLVEQFGGKKLVAGPSGVGLIVPGFVKVGAIGGVMPNQLIESGLLTPGNVAVVSTSGGMVNELISGVARAGKRMSFSFCIGGDRFPVTSLTEVFSLAENDPATKSVVYFGELGGEDEYEIVELIKAGKFTKPLLAYIAGTVDEAFPERTQFGHAKALAMRADESARAKREALRASGAAAPDTFAEFLSAMKELPQESYTDPVISGDAYQSRRSSLFSTRKIYNAEKAEPFVDGDTHAKASRFTHAILGALLPRAPKSEILPAFTEASFELLIDHGGNVSGAVNTMITARAGKDLVSSVASGLLTVGPRFGGAISAAAGTWLRGVETNADPASFVESETNAGRLIPGIGHRKYRVGIADPRVEKLSAFVELLKAHPHYDFARSIEKVTTGKNGSLILNVDGVVAALLLDILKSEEGYSNEELKQLAEAEFFNAFFIIPRTVGFLGHALHQKRNDEGLFRLPDDLLFTEEN